MDNYFYPGQSSNLLQANVVALADNSAITSGTVYFYLRARTGAQEGKWWNGSTEVWSATEVSAGSATYVGGAVWELEIDNADCWLQNTSYTLYWAESGALHKPDSGLVIPVGVAWNGTLTTTPGVGVVDICNYAIALIGTVAQANLDYLDTYDGNPTDSSSNPAMAHCQRLYPIARDYSQVKLMPPECLKYAAPGAALATGSANTSPGWEYMYSKPDGCLLFLGVVVETQADEQTGLDLVKPFSEIGGQIACNESEDILFKYIERVEDTTKFSQGLTLVTAHRLAYLLARPMGLDAENKQALLVEFEAALKDAQGLTGRRTYRQPPQVTVDTAHYQKISGQRVYLDSANRIHLI